MNDLIKTMGLIDLELLEKLQRFLKPFKDAAVVLSSESTCTISLIRPIMHQLLAHSAPECELSDPPIIHQAKAVLYHDLEKRLVSVSKTAHKL